MQSHPAVYDSCSYTSCEISRPLAQRQRVRVAGHGRQYRVEVRDGADVASWGAPQDSHCFVLGTELLDNCAHDKCVSSPLHARVKRTWHLCSTRRAILLVSATYL